MENGCSMRVEGSSLIFLVRPNHWQKHSPGIISRYSLSRLQVFDLDAVFLDHAHARLYVVYNFIVYQCDWNCVQIWISKTAR